DVYANSVTAANLTMEIDDSGGLIFNMTTTGDFVIQDSGTATATFGNAGDVTLNAQRGTASALQLISTSGGIDISTGSGAAANDIDILSGSSVNLRAAESAADAITIVTLGAAGGIDISTGGQLGQGGSIDILGGQGAAAAITIVAPQGGIDISTGSATQNIDILSGASINLTAAESAADSIVLTSSAGGIDILATGASAGEDIDITATGSSVNVTSSEGIENAVTLTASAGGINISTGSGAAGNDIAAAGEDIDIIATGSSVNLQSTENANDSITVVSINGGIDISTGSPAAGKDIDILSASSINLSAREGIADAITIVAGQGGIDISTGSGTQDIDILSGDAITLKAGTNGITLSTGTTTDQSGILLNGSGDLTLGGGITLGNFASCTALETDSSGVLACGSDGGGGGDFDDTYATTITNSNFVMEIDNTNGLTFNMTTTGDFVIQDGGTATATFGNAGNVSITAQQSAANAIELIAGTGGIDISTGSGTQDIDILGGDSITVRAVGGEIVLSAGSATNGSGIAIQNDGFLRLPTLLARIWVRVNGLNRRFNSASNVADFSEYIAQSEPSEQGDVMVIDQDRGETVRKSKAPYEENVLGVVSETGTGYNSDDCEGDESKALGECERDGHPDWANVGMLGQIDVKVTTENGPIAVGDRLTTSSIPGVAMKATEAGQIVGRALEAYTEADPTVVGKVWTLVSPSYFDPTIEADEDVDELLVEAENVEPYVAQIPYAQSGRVNELNNFGKYSIQRLVGGTIETVGKFATAIVANLKSGIVVSDEVATQAMLANQAAVGELTARSVTIGGEGEFIMTGSDGIEVARIDESGNAVFAGTLTADTIRANTIEGLEVLTNDIDELAFRVGQLEEALAASSSAVSGEGALSFGSGSELDLEAMRVGVATVSGELTARSVRVLGSALVEGVLNVVDTLTSARLIVNDLAYFFGEVVFKSKVWFAGRPTFNQDTAGVAVIRKGADEVVVSFDEEYEQVPMVNVSVTLEFDQAKASAEQVAEQERLEQAILNGDLRYIVTRKTTRGFVIKLSQAATEGLTFSWTALAVKDGKTVFSEPLGLENSPSPGPSPGPPSPSPSPTATPAAEQPESTLANTVTVVDNELGMVRIRDGPGTNYAEIGQIPVGETVAYTEVVNDWYLVTYQGIEGWVSGTYVTAN
ncbi:MAG: SH3 domain-containing protein, partial [Candidatus Chisholmbacteria bacterium]|nr:SH3 domain-containing protein [Candidatus Chisholmbacteria bacterium]